MSNAAKHRKRAVEFEQLKQFDKAISAYMRTIESAEEDGEEVDVALFNKVGDLTLRLGRVPEAVTYYERAVEHYANSGLFNNAIALCNKILRNAPGRSSVYFTLGKICARKGLRGDASRNFLEYVSRMRAENQTDAAMRALAEVVEQMPELTEIRALVDEHAARSGLVLTRVPPASRPVSAPAPPPKDGAMSTDLVFLDVGDIDDYETPVESDDFDDVFPSPTPAVSEVIPPSTGPTTTASASSASDTAAPVRPLPDEIEIAEPIAGLIAWGELLDPGISPLEGLTVIEPEADEMPFLPPPVPNLTSRQEPVSGPPQKGVLHNSDLLADKENVAADIVDHGAEPVDDLEYCDDDESPSGGLLFLEPIETEAVPELDAAIRDGGDTAARYEQTETVDDPNTPTPPPPFRVDPHAFILPGELPPLILPDEVVHQGLREHFVRTPVGGIDLVAAASESMHAHAATDDEELERGELEDITDDMGDAVVSGDRESRSSDLPFISMGIDDAVVVAEPMDIDADVAHVDAIANVDEVPHVDAIAHAEAVAHTEAVAHADDTAHLDADAHADDVAHADDTAHLDADAHADDAAHAEVTTLNAYSADGDVAHVHAHAIETPHANTEATADDDTDVDQGNVRGESSHDVGLRDMVAEANAAANSRRDTLRAAAEAAPTDWAVRQRLAEALLEVGERDAGITELEAALNGYATAGQYASAFDIAEELVRVGGDRIAHHQRRVELAVRLGEQSRLSAAYLDLADALVRLGMDARAHAVYARVLELDPWDERARSALGSAAPPPPPQPVKEQATAESSGTTNAPAPSTSSEAPASFASWLRDDGEEASTRLRMREPELTGDEGADFDALLRHFKEGVARSLNEDDHDSHYDLGVAFKEMGLLDDAIGEFQKALRSRAHRLPAYEALGQCFVEQGRHQVATTVLSRALHEPGLDDGQRIGVLYLLGYSSAALQRWSDARGYFERVHATDRKFRDVAARLAAIEQVAR